MNEFLDILKTMITWLGALRIPINVGDFSASISLWEIIIGSLVVEIVIFFIYQLLES